MRRDPRRRPVYKSLHQPMSLGIAGIRIDRRFVFLGAIAGMCALALLKSFVLAACLLVIMLAAGFATRHDPQMLAILWRAQFLYARYDPAKHEPFRIVVTDDISDQANR